MDANHTHPKNSPQRIREELEPSQERIDKLHRENAELEERTCHLEELNRTLMDSEQRLRLAIATGRIGLWVWNSTDVTNSGDWSPRLREIFGLPLDTEITHELFLKCVHPDDRGRVNAGVMAALEGKDGGEYRCEYRIKRQSDAADCCVTARGQAFFDSSGRAVRFLGTLMDVTEQKHSEEASARYHLELEQRIAERTADLARINQSLRKSEDYLQLAIDTIPGLVWTSLPDGHIEYLNRRWLDYTGLKQEQAKGWGWQVAIHPDDLPGLTAYWIGILTEGIAGEYEARLRRHDGEFRWFLFRGVPLRDEEGKVVKWYGTNTDIEDRHASEHVVRGHLNALTHMLEVLAQERNPDQLPKHVVNTILTQLGAASVTIWERHGDKLDLLGVDEEGEFRTGAEAGYFEGSIPVVGEAPPLWVEALQTGTHFLIEDIDKEPHRLILADGRTAVWFHRDLTRPFAHLEAHLSARGVRGLLISPMFLAGRLFGIIGIRFKGTRVFGREEIELTKALAQQAMLALQVMHLSEESRRAAVAAERNRMARDIHDTLAQGFTGVIAQLQAAKGAAAANGMADAAEYIEQAEALARSSLGEARRSVRALRPRSLREGSLCMALEGLFKRMSTGTSPKAVFQSHGEARVMPLEWEEELLRIAQESLTNTINHANASQFEAVLDFEPEQIRLRLADDGQGFNPNVEHEGLGLIGMKERVDRMGGQFILCTELGRGTEILIVLHHPKD